MNGAGKAVSKNLVLVACSLSLALVMMDVTIVNVVLPSVRRSLNASISELQWFVDAYSLVVAGGLMTAGSLADRIGRKRVFLSGIIMFGAGSALCGGAGSMSSLILARAMQGVGGAMLNPVALSIIANVFVEPKERARAIGVWGMTSGAALALGPMVGGFVSELIGWRAVFWINLPIGLIALLMTIRFVPESRAPVSPPLDPCGQAAIAVAVVALSAALIQGPDAGWGSPLVLALGGFFLVSVVGFVVIETRQLRPILDFRFFRSLPFSLATVAAVMCFAVFSALLFLNTIYLQDVRGLSPARAGIRLMPFALSVMICAPLAGRLIAARGSRAPFLLASLGLTSGAALLTGLSADTPDWLLTIAYAVAGCGFGMCNAPITNAAVSGMPRSRAGVAAAVASTSRQIGAALGVAIAGTVRSGARVDSGADTVAAFLAATHPVWWLSVGLGIAIGVCGFIATGKRARDSALRVASAFDAHDRPG